MSHSTQAIVAFALMGLIIVSILVVGVLALSYEAERRQACEAQGGVHLRDSAGYHHCVDGLRILPVH